MLRLLVSKKIVFLVVPTSENKFIATNKPFSQKLFWTGLLCCHFIVLALLYFKFGFNTLNEGDKYLSRATLFAGGDLVNATQYQTFYIGYVVYLSVFVFLKTPVLLIFLSTYCISLFAYYKFHQLISAYINTETAKLWLIFICLSPLIQYWQFNLFSETFFIAMSLLFAYVCLIPELKNRTFKIAALALITIFSRPSGIFTIICVLLFMFYKNKVFTKKQALLAGSVTLLILFVGILFFFQLPYHDFSKYIANGSVYYGFPGWTSPELPPGNYTLIDCYQFIIDHKGIKPFLVLFIQKLNSFFLTTRPYYSDLHNYINQSHQAFYVFSIAALFISYKKQRTVYSFLIPFLTVILLNAFMIGLIFNEWSERHTLHVFPYIILLASYAIASLWKRYVKKQGI
ncbi:MAG: hypothetical protein V4677_15375 [Bacteroidota bacterium]